MIQSIQWGIDPLSFVFLEKIILSLMIGILIGIEREHWRADKKIFAGVRTFAITCITGTLATLLVDYIGVWILVITSLLAVLSSAALIYVVNILKGKSGLTTAIALFCTYLLGIVVAQGLYLVAIVTALILTFILIEKKPLHSFAEHLSESDINSAIKFLAVAFVLYPIMPEEPIYGILRLKSAILIVVLVSFISFVSYISLKKMGPKGGIPYSGFFGGFISSEATVAALSGLSMKRPILKDSIHIGSMLAVVSMIISNTIIALIADPTAKTASLMAPPFVVMGSIAIIVVALKWKNTLNLEESIDIGSPFALGPAFKFGAVFTILLVIANFANEYGGTGGAYVTALGGIVSSSAVTASVAALAFSGNLSVQTAAETAILAGLISTLSKTFYIKVTGSPELFKTSLLSFIAIVAAGSVTLIIWSFYIRTYLG
ncbi:MgtC/SapB family protein [Methanolobus mangrovi]|uniref:MgtC/SapB family protein n=1 Tax=Methanolobus mangrovi TaxID=3072977 RepID=A0AA51UD74_9EURY|nr:MgtC/SapB family protein [Methanolobus mangrovi]WMW21025.1 MgtC/SapB family protein [Methanolobus mangrovi]